MNNPILEQLLEKFGEPFKNSLAGAIAFARHHEAYILLTITNNNLEVVGIGNDYTAAKADVINLAEKKVPHIFVGPQFLIIGHIDQLLTTPSSPPPPPPSSPGQDDEAQER